jgi:hypothetical protein
MVWSGSNWLRKRTSGGLMWTRWWTFGFLKIAGISWMAAQLAASQEVNHSSFISYGKNSFGIRPVWYKSKDLERNKNVYRGTTGIGNENIYLSWYINWTT